MPLRCLTQPTAAKIGAISLACPSRAAFHMRLLRLPSSPLPFSTILCFSSDYPHAEFRYPGSVCLYLSRIAKQFHNHYNRSIHDHYRTLVSLITIEMAKG